MFLKSIKIGNLTLKNNILVAPLAGFTNLPTRMIYREQGEIICFTEMVSALGLKYNYEKSLKIIETIKEDFPLGVQIFGPDADSIVDSFLKIQNEDFQIIDLNCGCSVKKVLKSNSGANLLKYPDEIYLIIKKLKENTDKPVSLKIRSGWDEKNKNYLEVLDAAEKGGADFITFHPRTKAMLFKGNADWNQIKELKKKSSIPVIGNGDIFTKEDAHRMFEETKCDGIMLARGLIENPFLIKEIINYLSGNETADITISERISTLIKHLEYYIDFFGRQKGMIEFRKISRGYLKGLKNVSVLRQKLNLITEFDDFKREIDNFFKK